MQCIVLLDAKVIHILYRLAVFVNSILIESKTRNVAFTLKRFDYFTVL